MMGMGPAWTWVSCSSASPVSLKTLQHCWVHYEFLRQWSKTRGRGTLPKWWCLKTRCLRSLEKRAFQTYHHSCWLPVGSMAMFNLPPKLDLSFLALSPFSATAQPRLPLDPEQDLEDGRRNPVPFLLFSSSTHSTCTQPLKVGIPCVHVFWTDLFIYYPVTKLWKWNQIRQKGWSCGSTALKSVLILNILSNFEKTVLHNVSVWERTGFFAHSTLLTFPTAPVQPLCPS